jgi:hypothetical protein
VTFVRHKSLATVKSNSLARFGARESLKLPAERRIYSTGRKTALAAIWVVGCRMDRAELEKRLQEAESLVARDQRNIAHQHEVIATLERGGHVGSYAYKALSPEAFQGAWLPAHHQRDPERRSPTSRHEFSTRHPRMGARNAAPLAGVVFAAPRSWRRRRPPCGPLPNPAAMGGRRHPNPPLRRGTPALEQW